MIIRHVQSLTRFIAGGPSYGIRPVCLVAPHPLHYFLLLDVVVEMARHTWIRSVVSSPYATKNGSTTYLLILDYWIGIDSKMCIVNL